MTSKAVPEKTHIPCPNCDSSDAYVVYDDDHGWCFSCNTGNFPKSIRPEDLEEVEDYDGFRSINGTVCKRFNISTYLDENKRVIYRQYQYPDGVKYRRVQDKHFWSTGKLPSLGGTNLFTPGCAHYITVVEGEEDAAAAFQMLNTGATLYPVVWLTSASIPNKARDDIYNYLRKFETVKIAIEDDEPGKKAKQILFDMLPNKIREVQLTKHKDANDYLINGDEKEFARAWHNASVYTPDNIYHTEADVHAVLENDEVEGYFSTSFPSLNEKIRGIPLNHVTLLTGMEGIGKTEVLRALEYDALMNDLPIAVLHMEETKKTLYKGLACYILEKNCRDPDNPVPIDEVVTAIEQLSGGFQKLFVFEFKNNPDVNQIMEQINYLVHVCGVKYIFIDPINQFDPIDDTSKVDYLDDLAKSVEKYAAKNPVGFVWTAHVDDEGRTRNSRMISKACSIRVDLKRDLMAEEDEDRNTVFMYVSKNRPFSKTGSAGFASFDPDTFTMMNTIYQAKEVAKEKKILPF